MIGITGRKKLIIQTVHNKRVARSREAAKTAHEHLQILNDHFMELMGMEPVEEKQERLN